MKKFFALICSLCMIFALAACNSDPAPGSDGSGNPAVPSEPDNTQNIDQNDPSAEPTGWDTLLDQIGFISNEKAYGMTRDEYHDLVGQPDISQPTYYDDFQADIYYIGLDDDSDMARVIELDFDLSDLSGEAKPGMIRLTDLNKTDLSDGSGSEILKGGTLGLTLRFKNKSMDELLADTAWTLGEPAQSDLDKWGFATWYTGQKELSVYLDAEGKILYFQARSMMDDALDAQEGSDLGSDLDLGLDLDLTE